MGPLPLAPHAGSPLTQPPPYTPIAGVVGTLKVMGSDSMNNEMALWAEGFRRLYAGVKIEVEGKGSATAPPALTAGGAHLGPMSRPMKSEEIRIFRKKWGYPPTAVKTSIDVLAIYVHKDNPIQQLTLEQVDALFSRTRRSGVSRDLVRWGDLGLGGAWADRPVTLYGRNSASGTYGFFKEQALFGGDFKEGVKEQPGSSSVVQAIGNDLSGIGYSGVGYKTLAVKAVPLVPLEGGTAVFPSAASAYAGTYPLTRFLLIYVNKNPSQPMDLLRTEFLHYILSQQGQSAVVKNGYIPLSPSLISQELKSLDLLK